MAVSIDNYLRNLAASYYLKNDSNEVARIKSSIDNLLASIDKDLGNLVKRRFVFGSYDRDTILPRKFDAKSDVDVMVIFNHTAYEREPETYRSWLKSFADKFYKERYGSEVVKSFPTVTIRLNNINYDMVPAKEENGIIYIPSNAGWQTTDPNDVKLKLTTANQQYNQIVRPIIRLFKAWNSTNTYPYDSYDLELKITGMNFANDDVQSGFFYAVELLVPFYEDSQFLKEKLMSLKYNIEQTKSALYDNDLERAKRWLHRILPEP